MEQVELAVVGAGPAGLSAAVAAARLGVQVAVFDENSKPGGQLFKQIHKFFGSSQHLAGVRGYDIGQHLLEEAEAAGVAIHLDTTVYGLFPGPRLGLVCHGQSRTCRASGVVVATGATENALAFPGWTLPGVLGAGAAQTLVNLHRVLPGRRVLMVGSGNVGLIVSYQLLQAGARVVAVVEAADKIGGYAVHAAKLRRAGVPVLLSHSVLSCQGNPRVEKATVCRLDQLWQPVAGTERQLEVDTVCLAVGLSPLCELLWMMGASLAHDTRLGGHFPVHDEDLRTSVPGVWVAGDASGVEEASTAMEEGRLAGLSAAEFLGKLTPGEAKERKAEVRQSLEALRSGAFGEIRRRAKAQVTQEAGDCFAGWRQL
ncbi:MAG: FAD-dependent oxidoreductase [Bacillota bacterium]